MTGVNLHALANPGRFRRFAIWAAPIFGVGAILCAAPGLWLGLFTSPPDYQQGETVRIMYVHVPAAWVAMFAYACLAGAAASALVWRHPLGDVAARACAPIGAAMTAIALITGAIWGQPTWGTWWVWDARLTSVLLLFFLYLGHIALTHAFDEDARGERAAHILALVGVVNLPVIKFSVDWWNTLHQPASVSRFAAPSIHPDMLTPLLLMAAAFFLFFGWCWLTRIRAEMLSRRRRAGQRRRLEAQ
ncbi:MAG: heme ABC transporter permease [Pseudomonadota bacterium]